MTRFIAAFLTAMALLTAGCMHYAAYRAWRRT